MFLQHRLPQILLDSILIQTYDASTRYESPVVIKVSQNHAQSQRSAEPTKHKLEILVENMGRTNFVWDMKRMRKGNVSKCSNYMQKATTYCCL